MNDLRDLFGGVVVGTIAGSFVRLALSVFGVEQFVAGPIALILGLGVALLAWRYFNNRTVAREIADIHNQPSPESSWVIARDGDAWRCTDPTDNVESIAVADVAEITIVTTDEGPFLADVWWLLIAADGKSGLRFPQGTTGENDVLEWAQSLPGFDNERFIAAMGSTDNGSFACWRRMQSS